MTSSLVVRAGFAVAVCLCCATSPLAAQVSGPMTAAVGRARGLIDAGSGVQARALMDSLVTAAAEGSDDRAEALYWRALLSESAADASRDWKRLVVDAPLSIRAADSYLRLGELEVLRGQAEDGRTLFARVARDFVGTEQAVRATLWIARTYADERNVAKVCEALVPLTGASIPEGELALQERQLRSFCATASSNAATAAPATPTAGLGTVPSGPPTAGSAPPTAGSAPPTGGDGVVTTPAPVAFSVQLAAYDFRSQATALVARLAKRGIKARVDGTVKPFRVRVGRYETREEAAAALARLKKAGQSGFVAELPK
ncbi:MAG: SPOR domain-containing protein [Gemmatimonadaceae bacterium]|nr:SPOR domain-containing protein [Gemmatimonadaceae bacterium]